MLYILEISCEDAGFLKVVLLVKNIITILQMAVPILLILSLMLDAFKNVTDKEGWNKKIIKKMVLKIVAAVSIFLAPAIVNLLLSFFKMQPFQESDCWKNANTDYINTIVEEDESLPDLTDILNKIEQQLQLRKELQDNLGGNTLNSNGDFPLYLQGEEPWASAGFCSGNKTIASSGCGAAALASAISGITQTTRTPIDLATWLCANGHDGGGLDMDLIAKNGDPRNPSAKIPFSNYFGVTVTELFQYSQNATRPPVETKEKIMREINAQNAVVVLVPGHYVSFSKGTGDTVKIMDSSGRLEFKNYTIDEAYDQFINYAGRCSEQSNCGWAGAWAIRRK